MKKLFLCFCAALFAITGMCAEPVYEVDFYAGHQGGWTIKNKNLNGLERIWVGDRQYGMKASAYVDGAHAAESWLISPEIDLTSVSYAKLELYQAVNKGKPTNLGVKVSTDNGETWWNIPISMPAGVSWNFETHTAVIDKYVGQKIRLAFVYKSNTSICPTWEIKEVTITKEERPIITVDGLNFLCYNNGTASVVGIQPDKQDIVNIPQKISDGEIIYDVTGIEAGAFFGCSSLTSITIPNNITKIGRGAFVGCTNLTSISVEDRNRVYDSRNGCNAVIETSTNKLIAGCKNTIIPNGVKSLGAGAFSGCSGLTSITIPNSVTSIEYSAFSDCSALASIVVERGNNAYDSRNNCNAIIKTNTNRLIAGCKNTIIPNDVKSIGAGAFSGCSGLTSITIPEGITSIECNTFSGCSNMTSIAIPNSVTSIEGYAFSGCTKLSSITIPDKVTSIEGATFQGCSNLQSITIGSSVTYIDHTAFLGCVGLTSLVWNAKNCSTVAANDYYPGYHNNYGSPFGSLHITSITIGTEVTKIPGYLFYRMDELTSVTWNAKSCLRPNLAEYDKNDEDKIHDTYWHGITGQITSFTFGNAVEYIPNDLCYGMEKLTSITIPNSVKSIGGGAFSYCTGLTSVTIGNSVTGIGEGAFNGCSSLSELRLGAGLETVGTYAFAGCLRLGNIHSYAALPPLAEESSFANYNARLYVPCEVLGDYQLAIVFGNFKYIDCISSDGVDVPTNTVTVTPSYEDATFTWPSNGNANAYTLEITKDGVVFCTLTFNANGQLMGIAFAPSKDRNNAHAPQAAQATTNGWQFTVTGLNESSNYAYTMTVTDNGNKVLQTYEGTFTTLGGNLPEGLTQTSEIATGIQKVIRNGKVLILRGGKTYTLTGQEAGE